CLYNANPRPAAQDTCGPARATPRPPPANAADLVYRPGDVPDWALDRPPNPRSRPAWASPNSAGCWRAASAPDCALPGTTSPGDSCAIFRAGDVETERGRPPGSP